MTPESPVEGPSLAPSARLGPYCLEQTLGFGGFASVWRAVHDDGHTVALKVLHDHFVDAEQDGLTVADRFVEEARMLARLEHPCLPKLLDIIDERPDGRALAYAMEWVDGVDLARCVDSLSLADVLHVFATVSEVLAFLHRRDIIHRDVKPANILVHEGSPPRVTLIDFGVAKDFLARDGSNSTATGAFVGTLPAMAPECFLRLSGEPLDLTGAVDQWALGVGLYSIICGRPPFESSAVFALIEQIQSRPAPTLQLQSRFQTPFAADVDCVVQRCLDKSPERRFPSMLALADRLRRLAILVRGDAALGHETVDDRTQDDLHLARDGLLALCNSPDTPTIRPGQFPGAVEDWADPQVDTQMDLPRRAGASGAVTFREYEVAFLVPDLDLGAAIERAPRVHPPVTPIAMHASGVAADPAEPSPVPRRILRLRSRPIVERGVSQPVAPPQDFSTPPTELRGVVSIWIALVFALATALWAFVLGWLMRG